MRPWLALLSLLGTLLVAPNAFACSCVPTPETTADAFHGAHIVAQAQVVMKINHDAPWNIFAGDNRFNGGDYQAILRVSKQWKGPKQPYLILGGGGCCACTHDFDFLGSYVLFVYQGTDGRLSTTICSKTRRISESFPETIAGMLNQREAFSRAWRKQNTTEMIGELDRLINDPEYHQHTEREWLKLSLALTDSSLAARKARGFSSSDDLHDLRTRRDQLMQEIQALEPGFPIGFDSKGYMKDRHLKQRAEHADQLRRLLVSNPKLSPVIADVLKGMQEDQQKMAD